METISISLNGILMMLYIGDLQLTRVRDNNSPLILA